MLSTCALVEAAEVMKDAAISARRAMAVASRSEVYRKQRNEALRNLRDFRSALPEVRERMFKAVGWLNVSSPDISLPMLNNK